MSHPDPMEFWVFFGSSVASLFVLATVFWRGSHKGRSDTIWDMYAAILWIIACIVFPFICGFLYISNA